MEEIRISVASSLASGVREILSTRNAYGAVFAALKSDGSMVFWGNIHWSNLDSTYY